MSGALNGPFIILLQEQGAEEPNDSIVNEKDADDLGASLDLAVETLDRICRMKLCPVLHGKGHVGKHILFCALHQRGEFRRLQPDLVGDIAPFGACHLRGVRGEDCGDEGGDDAPSALPGMASALRMK